MLDMYQLSGVVASWWGEIQYDITTLADRKFSGVVRAWLTTIEAAFESDGEDETRDKQRIAAEKRKAREHSAVPLLIPDYLTALEVVEAHRGDLDAQLKAATAKPDDEDADADDVPAETLSPQELKELRAELADARTQVRRLENDFLKQLRSAANLLTADQEEFLVRRIMKADLKRRLDAEFTVGLTGEPCGYPLRHLLGAGVRMAFERRPRITLDLEKTGNQRVLERPQGDGPRLVCSELAQGWRERLAPGLGILPEPGEPAAHLREGRVTGAGERLVGRYQACLNPADRRLVAGHQVA